MKRILGQLSRDFHKGSTPLIELLPQVKEIFEKIQKIQKISTNPTKDIDDCLNMIINIISSDAKFTEDVYNWASDKNCLTEQICTAMIRSVVVSDVDRAIRLIENMSVPPHLRTFIPVVSANLSLSQFEQIMNQIKRYNITPTDEMFSYLISKAPKGTDIQYLIEWSSQHCNYLDDRVINSLSFVTSVITNLSEVCQYCHHPIEIVHITNDQRKLMLASIFEENEENDNPSIVKWVQNRDYNIVIDGANVAHYNNSPFDLRKIIVMIDKINETYQNPKILLVFNICRKKITISLIKKWKNLDVFYTKSGTNDDLSWLYAGIYYANIWCITNDQMRDHVYYKFTDAVGRNVINLWMERNIVSYHFDTTMIKKNMNVQISLNVPLSYSVRPQVNGKSVHIPIKHGWCCATL